jgi:Siphovirus Gp157
MQRDLRHGLAEYQYLRGQLQAEFPEADEETLRDTLEGLSSLPEALAAVVRSYLDDLALAAALGIRIGDMQERLARFEHRADKKRELVTSAMERASLKKLAEPDFTVSLRAVPPSVVVIDEALIPQDYWKPQPPRLDRQSISAALKSGSGIPGAALSNSQMTISVRTK